MKLRLLLRPRAWKVGVLAVLALLVWSSWTEPSLHEYAPTTEFITLSAPSLHPGPAAQQLQARAQALPGVTACALRPDKQLLTLAYHPDEVTADEVRRRLGLRPLAVAAPDPSERQCPVPAGYVLALERVRFALNLRRLFVSL
ncbi:hypothetical protein [Hymenobacter chitinivorans]|uniref:Heavy-metal-associated domain-containing protein n=1 Tax=Hymenobacter chitinivorans DSM 11115 TaxID=1121954 RepID=A0A2M9AS50_9BACT|nr:hypothetical protein [Hymenobacter chitinivorans]PJJ48519.1 hypothetical protein CLV45_4227 [Hymenobacter chitinivorans DSM 11115]